MHNYPNLGNKTTKLQKTEIHSQLQAFTKKQLKENDYNYAKVCSYNYENLSLYTDKKENQIFLKYKASSYMGKYLRISSYIRKPFLIYDFATAPL